MAKFKLHLFFMRIRKNQRKRNLTSSPRNLRRVALGPAVVRLAVEGDPLQTKQEDRTLFPEKVNFIGMFESIFRQHPFFVSRLQLPFKREFQTYSMCTPTTTWTNLSVRELNLSCLEVANCWREHMEFTKTLWDKSTWPNLVTSLALVVELLTRICGSKRKQHVANKTRSHKEEW